MDKFSYYSISGKFKEVDVPNKNIQNMVGYMEHFEDFKNYDETEDKLLMVYKNTDIKIVDKDEAKKLIEKYLQK